MSLAKSQPLTIETNLSSEYVLDWGVRQMLRELIQNCVDAGGEVSTTDTHLVLRNKNTVLSPKVLFMGIGTKSADGTTIGQHGEGLKLAMLVAARAEQDIMIHNGTKSWTPAMAQNELGVTVLSIAIDNLPAEQVSNDFTIKVELPTFPLHEVWLGADKACGASRLVSPRYAGKVYSNGLYVCEINSPFGYNVGYLSLERDRRVSDIWELRDQIAKIWEKALQNLDEEEDTALRFARLLFEGKTVEADAFNYRPATPEVQAACRGFLDKEYPENVAVKPGSQLTPGGRSGGKIGLAVSTSFSYGLGGTYWATNNTKTDEEIWWDAYHEQLTEEAQTSLRKLLF